MRVPATAQNATQLEEHRFGNEEDRCLEWTIDDRSITQGTRQAESWCRKDRKSDEAHTGRRKIRASVLGVSWDARGARKLQGESPMEQSLQFGVCSDGNQLEKPHRR